MHIPQNRKIIWILLLGFISGVAGETLLFVQKQCRQLETLLMDDFRIVAFIVSDQHENSPKVLEEKLRAVKGVRDVRYVSRESALALLQEQDPELVRSVALLGENPMHAGFEIRIVPEAVSKMPGWLHSVSELHELGDVQYKPLELTAISQLQFYNRFLDVAMSLAAFAWLLGALGSIWVLVTRPETRRTPAEWSWMLGAGAAGTMIGMGIVFLAALPLKPVSQMWAWPQWQSHLLLIAVGLIGASLFPDIRTGLKNVERHGKSSHHPAKVDADEPAEGIVGAGR